MEYPRKARLLGRLANGNEADSGTLVHVIRLVPAKRPPCPYNDFGRKVIENDDFKKEKSLCGKSPGKRSVGWQITTQAITCEVCLKRFKKEAS